ncbi:MAG: OadG family protein [Bacillota bacterium]|nr:OadG family protein [Bacillota bacterium]
MSLMELFSNPETIDQLSFGDKMLASTITMCMGLGITFMVLILIWVFIAIMGKCLNVSEKKNKATPAPVAQATVEVEEKASDDESLIAVITAAIAAYQGDSASNLVVKKITRLSGENTPWGASGLEDRLETRKL